MSSFLEQLRAKARENQSASSVASVPSGAESVGAAEPSPVGNESGARDARPDDAAGRPADSQAGLGHPADESQVRAIEGTESKPADSPAPAAKASGLSFLAGLNRRVAATAPTNLSRDSSALADDTSNLGADARLDEGTTLSGGDEDDSLGEAGPDSSGRGDAPINAATIVEGGDSTALVTTESQLSGAELFKLRLASLAELCQTESGITPLVHDTVKAHVAGIMTDLRDNPEMRGLLLDGDMHNIMLFVQSSTTVQQTKVEKTQTKRATASKKAITASAFDSGFDMLDNVPSLQGVAALNSDNIETKVR